MNAFNMARTAYSSAESPLRSAQATEYEVFARITRRIKEAAAQGSKGFAKLAAALHDNRRLWMALATDVADPENKLPTQLKAQILSLAQFTINHTTSVLEESASVDALIDINVTVMKGLRGQGSGK